MSDGNRETGRATQIASGGIERRGLRSWVLAGLVTSLIAGVALVGLQAWLEWDESCSMTPPGHFNQELVSIDRKLLWNECTLDPHNGEGRYVIRSPWQQVRSR